MARIMVIAGTLVLLVYIGLVLLLLTLNCKCVMYNIVATFDCMISSVMNAVFDIRSYMKRDYVYFRI